MLVGGYWISVKSKNFNFSLLIIGFDYIQVIFMFSSIKIHWPPLLLSIFRTLAIFSFNIDVAAPECLLNMPEISYEQKWWGTVLLPLVAVGFLLLIWICRWIYEYCRAQFMGGSHKRRRDRLWAEGNRLLAVAFDAQYFLYLTVNRRALDIFNCNPLDPPDGFLYTEFTSSSCISAGGDDQGGL